MCEQYNIIHHLILGSYPTISKQRFVENTYDQQLLRVDYENIYEKNQEYNSQIMNYIKSRNPEYIVISDYNK